MASGVSGLAGAVVLLGAARELRRGLVKELFLWPMAVFLPRESTRKHRSAKTVIVQLIASGPTGMNGVPAVLLAAWAMQCVPVTELLSPSMVARFAREQKWRRWNARTRPAQSIVRSVLGVRKEIALSVAEAASN